MAGELSAFDESTLEDHEFSKLYFTGFRDELKDFSGRTDNNFREMAEKYGDISKELKEFRETVNGFLKAFFQRIRREGRILSVFCSLCLL